MRKNNKIKIYSKKSQNQILQENNMKKSTNKGFEIGKTDMITHISRILHL